MVERLHRTLKTTLTAHDTVSWSLRLPIVLLALRNTVKPDIGHTPAEIVYGMSLWLSGDMFHPAPPEAKTVPELARNLRDSMTQLQPTPGSNHATKRYIFVSPDLNKVTHVFLWVDAVQPPLQPRYKGPYAVLERHDKNFRIQRNNSKVLETIDRLKPAFVLREDPAAADHTYATHAEVTKQSKYEYVFLLAIRGSSVATHNNHWCNRGISASAVKNDINYTRVWSAILYHYIIICTDWIINRSIKLTYMS